MHDHEESSEGHSHDLIGHDMIWIDQKECLVPVPDWLYPSQLTVRTRQRKTSER